MNQMIFAVYDLKARFYGTPFFSQNVNTALRSFAEVAMDSTTSISKFPTDYSLWYLGYYNSETGHITSEKPEELALASRFNKLQEPQ